MPRRIGGTGSRRSRRQQLIPPTNSFIIQRGAGSGSTGGTFGSASLPGSTLIIYVVSNSATQPTVTLTGSYTGTATCGYWSAGHNGDYTGIFYLPGSMNPGGITGYTTSGIYASYYREVAGLADNPIVYWNFGGNATASTTFTNQMSGYAVPGDFTTYCTGYDVSNGSTPYLNASWQDEQIISQYGQTGWTLLGSGQTGASTMASGTYDACALTFKRLPQDGPWAAAGLGQMATTWNATYSGSIATLNINVISTGSLLVLHTKVANNTQYVSAVSSSDGAAWQQSMPNFSDTYSSIHTQNQWYAQTQGNGVITITVTFNTALSSTGMELMAQEFGVGTPNVVYGVDSYNTANNGTAAQFHTWPTFNPTASPPELFVGFARIPAAGTLSVPSGPAVLQVNGNHNPFLFACNLRTQAATTGPVCQWSPQIWDTASAQSYPSGVLYTFTIVPPPTAISQADAAAAADSLSVAILNPTTETDNAGAAETLAVTATTPLADAAAAADSLAVTVSISLSDSAAGSDTITATPWAWVQSASAQSALTTTISKAFTRTNVSAGNKLIALVGASTGGGAVSTTSVADTASTPNQMTRLGYQALSNNEGEISLWAMDVPAGDVGTMPTIKATCNASGSGMAILLAEISGLNPGNTVAAMLDGAVAWVSGTTLSSSLASPSYTSSQPGELLLAFYGDWGNPTTWTNPAGYQGATAGPGSAGSTTGIQNSQEDALEIAYKSSTGGAETAHYGNTGTAGPWLVGMVAFLLAGQASAVTEADTAGAADTLSTVAAVPTPDVGGAADVISISANSPAADQAAAVESLAVAVTVSLADAAGAADVTAKGVFYADAAAAAESLAVTATLTLSDVGSAAESGTVIGVTSTDVSAAADQLSVVVSVQLTDVAAGADALLSGQPTTLADAAGAAETFTISATAGPIDQGAASDALAVSATAAVIDAAAAADQLTVAVAVALADQAAGSDAVAPPTASVPLADRAAAADAQVAGPVIPPDAAGATEQLTVQVAVTLADAAAAAESMVIGTVQRDAAAGSDAVAVTASMPLPDLAAGDDTLTVTAAASLADSAGAAESISVVIGNAVSPADVATATDSLAVAASIPLGDAGASADTLAAAAQVTVADAAGAADSISVAETIPVAMADTAGTAEALAVAAATPLAELGSGVDVVAVSAALSVADAAGAADAISVVIGGQTVALADSAAAADVLSVQTATTLPVDAGGAAEHLAVSATTSLPDVACGVDTISVAISVALTDTAGAADQLTVAIGAIVSQADVAGAADQLAVAAAAPLAELAGAADQLTATASLGEPDSAAAAELLAVTASTTVADAAGAAEALSVAVTVPRAVGDLAAASDAISVAVSVSLSDSAASGDTLGVSAAVALSDVSGATEAVRLFTVVYKTGTVEWRAYPDHARWDAEPMDPRWDALPVPARWSAEAGAARWQLEPAEGRWSAEPEPARWRIMMQDFDPVAAISPEMINVRWTSDLDGTRVDPTSQPLPTRYALPVSSGDVSAPAQPAQWYTGSAWLSGGTGKGYVQQCPVGPGTTGPTLASGTKYDVWAQVEGSPGQEAPMKFVGVLSVY